MKKRILALFLALIMCIMMIPTTLVSAEAQTQVYAEEITTDAQVEGSDLNYSNWAFNDLFIGDSYGAYPLTWYNKDMRMPISQAQLRILLAGLRVKMLNTNSVNKINEISFKIGKSSTVEQVLTYYYSLVSSYEFTKMIGVEGVKPVTFMKDNGIYTGAKGELGLKDKCSIEQACVFATRLVTYVYNELDAASKGFLWVTKSGGNTVYMLGSIHLANNDIYPFSKEMLDAYQSANSVVFEVNIYDQAGANKLNEMSVYTDGTTLKDHVSDETYKKTVELGMKLGLTEQQVGMYKPWALYLSFEALATTDTGSSTEAAQNAMLGIDMNFLTKALYYGKPVLEIEGYEYQGKALDSFSDELEEYLLTNTVDAVNEAMAGTSDEGSDSIDTMLELWRTGDVDEFKKLTSMETEDEVISESAASAEEKVLIQEFNEKLLKQRDKGMANYIDGLLKAEGNNTYFVIVGSAHYISDHSVLDILKEKGYEISQIK